MMVTYPSLSLVLIFSAWFSAAFGFFAFTHTLGTQSIFAAGLWQHNSFAKTSQPMVLAPHGIMCHIATSGSPVSASSYGLDDGGLIMVKEFNLTLMVLQSVF